MSKNGRTNTKTVVYCAVLATMSIVLARLLGFPIMPDVRISLEAIPIMLAGFLFGPVAGACVGFVADFLGSLMTFGFTPILCLPPILIGLGTGLLRSFLLQKQSVFRWLMVQLPLFAVAYILWQSYALTVTFGGEGAFIQNYVYRLGTRSLQYFPTAVVDVLLVHLLYKAGVFHHLNLLPAQSVKKDTEL